MWPAERVRFLCNSNRALREICKVTPRMRAQISRSDAWKINWKVMKKHPKNLYIKELLHNDLLPTCLLLRRTLFKTKWVRGKSRHYKSGIGDNLVVITFAFYTLFIEPLSNGDYGTSIIRRRYGTLQNKRRQRRYEFNKHRVDYVLILRAIHATQL